MTDLAHASDSSYITLQEACAVTGLSAQTITRFAQAEYFKSKTNGDALLVDRAELCSVLNIKDSKKSKLTINKTAVAPQEASALQQAEPAAPIAETQPTPQEAPEPSKTDNQDTFEIQKLRALCELHEKYIEFKEKEVASLTNERDWLRARIEKLEEKNDRDQLILASMSETHRALATQISNKKSTIQLALEWLGVSPTPSSTSTDKAA